MRTAAVLPVKRFTDAKRRLGTSVPDALRRRLADAMVRDVLDALDATAAIAFTVVVSAEPALAEPAREHGAILVDDPHQAGQSQAVALGILRALAEGAERVLCVPGDCPALDPEEVRTLLERPAVAGSAEVAIVPDRHGTGTNGLLLHPPAVIEPSFGPGSCERHVGLARAARANVRIERVPSLLLDIDTGADLAVLRARLPRRGAVGGRTFAVLQATEPARSALASGA